jgi:Zn-dependent metalloprotease
MCIRSYYRNPIFCILPPYVLTEVAKGTDQAAMAALRTLNIDNTFRALRALPITRTPLLPSIASATGAPQRTIFTAGNQDNLPGNIIRTEGQPATGDAAADEAYAGLGATYDLYFDAYGRDSIDDEGLPLLATVHYGDEYNNAFWDGSRMVFGDGDGIIFNRFTIALDVIGHELAHGVTEDEGPLFYVTESGALNESLSDVFGSLVKQKFLNETAGQADWLIGAGLFAPGIQGVALRSMKAPGTAYNDPRLGKDPQPDHMKKFVRTNQDNGGVHINSGIPNKAFYVTATNLDGFAWEKAGRIWYETLRNNKLKPTSTFLKFANLTLATAVRLYGSGSVEADAVRDGWSKVGIKLGGRVMAAGGAIS